MVGEFFPQNQFGLVIGRFLGPNTSDYEKYITKDSLTKEQETSLCSIGDALQYHNNSAFSTKDRDSKDCAKDSNGAWWYNFCHLSNLNGYNYNFDSSTPQKGIVWSTWRPKQHSLEETEMAIYPKCT